MGEGYGISLPLLDLVQILILPFVSCVVMAKALNSLSFSFFTNKKIPFVIL